MSPLVITAAALSAVAVVLSVLVLRAVLRLSQSSGSGTDVDLGRQVDDLAQRLDRAVEAVRTDAAASATSLRTELRTAEQESRQESAAARQELLGMLGAAHEQVVTALTAAQQSAERLAREGLTAQSTTAGALAEAQSTAAAALRESLAATATAQQERQSSELGRLREELTSTLTSATERAATTQRESTAAAAAAQTSSLADLREAVAQRLTAVVDGQEALRTHLTAGADKAREEQSAHLTELRTTVSTSLEKVQAAQDAARTEAAATQARELTTLREAVTGAQQELRTTVTTALESLQKAQADARTETTATQARELKTLRETVTGTQKDLRTEVATQLAALSTTSEARLKDVRTTVAGSLKDLREEQAATLQRLDASQADKLRTVTTTLTTAQRTLTDSVGSSLGAMAKSTEERLEAMRVVVQEKLDDTLTKRLDSSFTRVSERLDLVGKGLHDMQALAQGVGSLQRTLTNVKHRGAWAELQLESLLADLLTGDQFVRQHRINPGSSELVDFAVRLPGTKDGTPVWLGIDSKFPMDAYERFQAAWEAGDAEGLKTSSKQLVDRVVAEARSISGKYVNPPHTTDFAVMYLPTEGLFAEVVRQPGLVHDLRTKHKVVVAGPTTLTALLSSMSMGFRTLAIEKRSSEVWAVLGSVKAEFEKSAVVWEKLEKQLQTAGKTAHETGVRHRAVERRLRSVESMPIEASLPRQVGVGGAADVEPLAALVGIDEFEVTD